MASIAQHALRRVLLGLVCGHVLCSQALARNPGDSTQEISLPAPAEWTTQLANVRAEADVAEVVLPINYKVGRVVSPAVAAKPGELFTLAADVRTQFAVKQPLFYRFWLEVEALKGQKVLKTFTSPLVEDTQESEQLLAVTAAIPAGSDGVRAVLCAQNKYWSIVDNKALVRNVRLLKLAGTSGGEIRIAAAEGLAKRSGMRVARLSLTGDWPAQTAVAVSTSRGTVARSVLLAGGETEIPLHYSAEDVGEAKVTAGVDDQQTTFRLADPQAARLVIDQVLADGEPTPVLVQLSRNGVMIPGRWQSSAPGIFVTPPWSIDLAPGRWDLRVCRGPEFQAHQQTLEVSSGKTVRLDLLELSRAADLRSLGWYGGDADGDVYHGERIYTDLSAETAAQIAQAMGLDWVGVGSWGEPKPRTWGEARAVINELSRPNFLFMWTDERPKTKEGHACFVGLERPDQDPFGWGWTGAKRPLRNFEMLHAIRAGGAATFANHPLRWWINGNRFNTNMYSSLPFDLCAAGLLDGVNINDNPKGIELWSMLLDHGYRVAATAGADFGLDRPVGPVPGKARMYCFCPEGLNPQALVSAVRQGHTVVSTGPVLLADVGGRPPGTTLAAGRKHRIDVKAWGSGDNSDELKRVELWTHGRVLETRTLKAGATTAETSFEWQPQGDWDWVAVRAVGRAGWAMTSAFYAAGDDWEPPQPVECELTVEVDGLSPQQLAKTQIEIWDGVPSLVTSSRLSRTAFKPGTALRVPVGASIVVIAPDKRRKETTVYDAAGMAETVEKIASGDDRERPLLDWKTYEDVLRRCRTATARIAF